MNPTVSIITPTYNHGKYIDKCINSLILQSYQKWEQIIVDDYSCDSTYRKIIKYSKKDKRIKLIRHKKNWGIHKLADTYNQALKVCKGKYIAILEGDDYWPKDKLEKQIKCFKDKNVIFSFGNCIMVNDFNYPIDLFSYNSNKYLLNNDPVGKIMRLFVTLKFSIIPCTVIIRKDSLKKIGGFQKDKNYPFTDIPTFLFLALQGKFSYINDVVGFYRKQVNSSWFNFAKQTVAMGRNEVKECVNNFINTNNDFFNKHNIIFEQEVYIKQEEYINKRMRLKKISYLLNILAFKYKYNPLTLIFYFKYITNKIRKILI